MMTLNIRPEQQSDDKAIQEIHRAAFEGDDEARLVETLRSGGYSRLSLVAEVEGKVVGHVLFSDLAIFDGDKTVPALALAPLGVLPEHQRIGIGTQLVQRGLADCRARGDRIVIVLGEPSYYSRFGFSAELARALKSPYSGEHFMAAELSPGALRDVSGRVQYAPPFESL